MKERHFLYKMELSFSAPVQEHFVTLRCLPMETPCQQTLSCAVETRPDTKLSRSTDGFGNLCLLGCLRAPHSRFSLRVEGRVQVDLGGVDTMDAVQAAPFRAFTRFTTPGSALEGLHRSLYTPQHMDARSRALVYMRGVHREIAYVPRSTTLRTTAEEAAARRMGACQDQAQILLALCRMSGIPCRYAAGLLEGEGKTHAWVEAYVDGGWLGLDATNDMIVSDRHIKLAHGRDHADCPLECGVFFGGAQQLQEVSVRVD